MTQSINYSNVTTTVTQQEQQPIKTAPLSLFENGIVGIIAGITEVTCNQPAANRVREIQQAIKNGVPVPKMSWSPPLMWSGFSANASGICAVTAVQVMINGYLKNKLSHNGAKELSNQEKLAIAGSAGALGALFACPSELIMDRQRQAMKEFKNSASVSPQPTYSSTISSMVKAEGIRVFNKGLIYTMLRDAKFTAGYVFLPGYLNEKMKPYVTNQVALTVLSCCTAGIICATFSHPWDTAKTNRQNNKSNQVWHSNLKNTVATHFAGFGPRAYRVVTGVLIFSVTIETLTGIWKQFKTQRSEE